MMSFRISFLRVQNMFENAVSAIVRKCTTCWKAWVGNNSILRDRESWGGDLSSVNLWRFDGRGGVGGGQLLGFASVTVEKEQTLSINFSGDGVWKVIPRRLMIQAWCCWLKAQAVMSLDGEGVLGCYIALARFPSVRMCPISIISICWETKVVRGLSVCSDTISERERAVGWLASGTPTWRPRPISNY